MKSDEEKIWDAITNSAKRKFDYNNFKNSFPLDEEYREIIADNIVWGIINGFQIKDSEEVIAARLFNELLFAGCKMDKVALAEFIGDKNELFKIEIGVSSLATDMLNTGLEPQVVYHNILKLL